MGQWERVGCGEVQTNLVNPASTGSSFAAKCRYVLDGGEFLDGHREGFLCRHRYRKHK